MERAEFSEMLVKDRVALLRERFAASDAWALRALEVVYAEQTADEKAAETTIVHNKVGFSGVDGEILSSFARQYAERGRLSPKQMALLKRKMPRYAKQVERLTRSEAEVAV